MNKRQRKKRYKRSYLGLTDEFYLIGMNEDELNEVFKDRENFRKKYGYRKKYKSKSRLKGYYITLSKRQAEESRKWYDSVVKHSRSYKNTATVTVEQSLEQLKLTYNE